MSYETQRVEYTVEWHYGSYHGTTKVLCDSDDDMEVVRAKVRKKENLNFLAMCSESYRIVDTRELGF